MKKLVRSVACVAGLLLWVPIVGASDYPADNSGKNMHDGKPAGLTAGDQSNAAADV